MKQNLLFKIFMFLAFGLSTIFMNAEQRSSISQYGITWYFNGNYECGQFVTGDWWVVGPVTINSVSPAPSTGRNGSCVNPMPNRQGYDDRSYPGGIYSTADRISYPATLNANQTLVSSVSRSSVEKNLGNMQSQAVLTVVSAPQPSGTFRPAYCGTYKKYFNTNQINMSIIPNLPPPSSVMNSALLASYTDPPRIDHLGTWVIQYGCAEDNWFNGVLWGNEKHKCYGQQYSELISEAALHAMLSIPEKTQLINNLIQFGIDNYGVLKAGGKYAADGGHYSGRKFPIVFAAVLLNDADMMQVGVDYTSRKFGEYDQTYNNSSGKALWGRRVSDYCWWYAGCEDTDDNCNGSKDIADPDQITDGCPTYRGAQTSRNWVGQALATLMIGGKSVWNHDAYFDYMDRWMDGDVGGGGSGHNAFVTDMWNLYRDNLPSGGGSVSVTGVSVSPSTVSIDEGMSQQVTVTVSPTDATNKNVTWLSNNTAVATVNSSGVVTGVAEGSATITATTLDGGFTDNCTVTVNSLGTNVALNKSVTVSDFDSASDKPGDKLVDGDVSDDARWSAAGFPQWAEIDLGADYSLNRIDVFPYQDRPYQYIIEGKPDGGSYTTIVDRSANTESADNLYDNVSATVRYLKITVSGISGNTSTWVSIAELKAFTNSAPPPVGTEFYCSPTGSMSNNGTSPSTPWGDLATVVSQKTFADGSTIYLMDGNHGSPVITESNTAQVTITKYAGANPVINNIDINGADYWTISDVKISANGAAFPNQNVPLTHPVYPLAENALVYISNSDNITIDGCEISSIDNSSVWTNADDWNYTAWNGVMVSGGSDVTVTGCHIKNVNFGNTAGGSSNYLFNNNIVENFCGDGMQLGSNYAKIEYNTFMNCYATNGNHDDILQFYAGSGNSYGVEIRGNKLINYTDPNQPFLGEAQGIGIFDGYQNNFIIENNLVVTDNWHGITVYGAVNCVVNNNSVIEINDTGIGPCWIQLTAAKDGTPATGNIVRNNLTSRLNNDSGIGTVENNDVISWSEYSTYFTNFANFDLSLAAGSPAIDAGTSVTAPSIDIDGVARPQGSGYDIGCYEYTGAVTIPVTAVSVSPATLTLEVGQSSELTEAVSPANATDQSVTWSSSNNAIATVGANGLVSALSSGQATISVTTVDGGFTANCSVTVTDGQQTTTTLSPVADAAVRGGTYENNNYGTSTNLTVKNDAISYTRESFLKFDLSGISQSVSSAILRLYVSDDGVSTHTAKLVSDDTWTETGITWANKPASGSTIASWDVTATGNFYIEADITSAVVSEAGQLLSINISASNNDYINYSSKEATNKPELVITMGSATVPVTGVSVAPASLSLEEGQSSGLTETISPVDATDQTVSWSSSDNSVATVDANGVVSALSGGQAIITVTTTDGAYTAICNVTVTEPIIHCLFVDVVPSTLNLYENESDTLSVVISPTNATDQSATWSSSNPSVATIDASGVVSALSAGQTTITATTNDGGFTAQCSVTVNTISTNLALNKPITVSAYQDDSFGYQPGTYLVDGDVTDDTRWSASGFPQWAEIDLGANYDLTRIDVYPYQNRAYQYIVEAKTSTGSYVTVVDRSANTIGADLLSDNVNTTARYIKITVTGISGSTSTWVSLAELEVYGALSSTVFVTGVSISPATLNLDEGQTSSLTATVSPADATDQTITWSSNNSSVASVDANGVVSAISGGQATIIATTNDGGYTANCTVTVTVPVTGVSVSPTTLDLDEGQTSSLTATISPADATDQTITWSSNNSSVASVDANGVVSAISGGQATIIATTNDGGYIANCTVTVTVPVTGVSVSPTTLDLDEGQTSSLTATISPADATDQTITWSSSNTSVATVDANGVVSAISAGQTTVTATTTDGGFTAQCSVTVNAINTNLALNKPITVSAYQDDSFGYQPGTYLVDGDVTDDTRWSASGFPQWAEIDLGANYDLTRIDVYPYQNRAYQYIVEAKTSTGSYVTVVDRSANTIGADLLSDDVNTTSRYIKITVTGISGSTSTWVSLAELEAYGTLSSTVFVTGVSLSSGSLNLDEGQTSSLSATVSPANASDQTVSWSSSNASVATVNSSGVVSALNVGQATITATTNDGGFTAECNVTVIARVAGVSVSPTTLDLDEGQTSGLTTTVLPADASDPTVIWSSSNTSVATIAANGLVTAIAAGNCTITATSNDGGYTANCSVTVTAIPQSRTISVTASNDDQEIRSNGGSQWVGYAEHRVGGAGAGYDGASVHPFQLPVLNSGEAILDASFTVNLKLKANSPSGNVDAYGLPYRATSGVSSTGDYWQGAFGADPNATPVQDDFAVSATPYGDVQTNSAGNVNLVNYINAQYAAGAQGGDYIFIRLNPDVADVDNYEYWVFYSANSSYQPVLDLEIGADPSKNANSKQFDVEADKFELKVYPNPVSGGLFYIELKGATNSSYKYSDEKVTVSLVDITGKLVFNKEVSLSDIKQMNKITCNTSLNKGVYLIKVTGMSAQKVGKLIVE